MRKTLEISQLTHDRRLAPRSRHSEIQAKFMIISNFFLATGWHFQIKE